MNESPAHQPTSLIVVAIVTAPFVPPEVDLRNFPYIPVFWRRLFASRFHRLASDAEWKAGFILWLRSWDEVPAGSLPNDERELRALAEVRDNIEWRKVKKWALHGWELCDDGRLYHPVVAEITLNAWAHKEANHKRTQAATEARQRHRNGQRDVPVTDTDIEAKKKPRARAREQVLRKNGADKSGAVRAVDPKILGHGDICKCANCVRWTEAHKDGTR